MVHFNPRYSLIILNNVRIPCGTKNCILLTTFLLIILIGSINAHTLTERYCNRTAFSENGCEEHQATKCVVVNGKERCACQNQSDYVLMGRFCVAQLCSSGQYYDRGQGECVPQSKASTDVTENHCLYDYHCFGKHVSCKQHGWNFNCVCNKGFIYDSLSKQCVPKFGIGGHCLTDKECDETHLRKIRCEMTTNDDDDKNPAKSSSSSSSSSSQQQPLGGGTCQCIENHRYNYNIDGCESIKDIRLRESNMRSLILLFVITGLLFGFAMTFNFGLFSGSSRPHEIYLQRLEVEKQIRKMKQRQAAEAASRKISDEQQQQQQQPSDSMLTNVDNNGVTAVHQSSAVAAADDKNANDPPHHDTTTINMDMMKKDRSTKNDDQLTSLIAL